MTCCRFNEKRGNGTRASLTVFTGLLNVAAISGPTGQVRAEWSAWSGAGWFEGSLFFVTAPNWANNNGTETTEGGPDPLTEFAPLTLTVAGAPLIPEPSTVVLAASALAILFLLRKSLGGRSLQIIGFRR